MPASRSIAVIGAGWAGLSAAVDIVERPDTQVTVFDMAPHPGGRARSTERDGHPFDNGQHILVGAYRDTLDLMRRVGVSPADALLRRPLALLDASGRGLRLPAGPPALAFARGVLAATHWPWRARLAMLRAAVAWRWRGFIAPANQTVADLSSGLPDVLVRELIDPLCVAALNTPSDQASAAVFLRVVRDALFGGPGASDLLLPRVPLAQLVPDPAFRHLSGRGASCRLRTRVQTIIERGGPWQVDAETFDGVVLACSAAEAARLVEPIDPAWSRRAAAVRYQSIITVYASHEDARLPWPMVALDSRGGGPAQFVFDHGILSGRPGLLAFVASGANTWLERGLEATAQASCNQARDAFGTPWAGGLRVVHTVAEKRATFACTPGLDRPEARVRSHLWAAGDYVHGPYPATLEGAVRSGRIAAAGLLEDL